MGSVVSDIGSLFSGRPKLSVPAPPPAGPTLADEVVRKAGVAAGQAALAGSGGRRAAFITAATGGESAPAAILASRSTQPSLAWDYGLEDTYGGPGWGKMLGRITADRMRRQGTY